jgi:hypothetical protein
MNAKQIFNHIQMINPTTSVISSLGSYVSDSARIVADSVMAKVIDAISKDSLAFKIITSQNGNFSEKQLWVIAYECLKNQDFCNAIIEEDAKIEAKQNQKREAEKNKLAANKEASANVLAMVKNSGKKLGDYYSFVKTTRPFKSEFFSKKFTFESANAFLAI